MRTILAVVALGLSTAAVSADEFPGLAPAGPNAPWSGIFIGVAGGYGWARDIDRGQVPPFPDHGQDWIRGVSAGYLRQSGMLVFGAEVEFSRLDIRFELAPILIIAERTITAKARVGVAFGDVMLSAFAGPGYATTNIGLMDWGWSAGLNLDYALTDHIAVGIQYSHHSFNRFDGTLLDARFDSLTARLSLRY